MRASDVISRLQQRGVTLKVVASSLKVGGAEKLSDREKAALRAHKASILRALEAPPTQPAIPGNAAVAPDLAATEPAGCCSVCGSNHFWLALDGWQCWGCTEPPWNATTLCLPKRTPVGGAGRGVSSPTRQTDAATFLRWTQSELARKAKVEAGNTVVASMRKGEDEALRAWAEQKGLLMRIDRLDPAHNDWRNFYHFKLESERDAACDWYASEHLPARPDLIQRVPELVGKVLACWCYPKRCHGDYLAALANGEIAPPPVQPDVTTPPASTPATCSACCSYQSTGDGLGGCRMHGRIVHPNSRPAELACGEFEPKETRS